MSSSGGSNDFTKPAEQGPHIITLMVKYLYGDCMSALAFKMKRSSELKKLMNAYCDRNSVDINLIAFYFDGLRLQEDDCPVELDMEDGDEIFVGFTDSSAIINLQVKGQYGNCMSGVIFRVKRSTKLKKLMNAYCDRNSVDINLIAFYFDGLRLQEDECPDELDMGDGDEILVGFTDSSAIISLKVKCQDGYEASFTIHRRTPLKKLMNRYCLGIDGVAFLFNGQPLRPEQTPDELQMGYWNEIYVVCYDETALKKLKAKCQRVMGQTKKKKEPTDMTWNHCECVQPHRLMVKCNYCSHTCWGDVARMKHHLTGTKENVNACPSILDEVKQMFVKLLEDKDNAKENQGCLAEVVAQDNTKKGVKSLKHKTMNEVQKDRELVIQDICKCIYGNALPFNLVRSPLFVQMLKSVGEYGKGLNPPSYHEVRVSYLQKAVDNIKEGLEKYKTDWEKWGCTLMCDGWTDGKGRSLTNFLVNCPSGTVFLKSIDTSDVIKDSKQMFDLLDSVIEDIGEDNVVQVVTDGASNLVDAGQLLEEKRKKLYWNPCAAHCLDLILEDIGQLPLFFNTIANAKKVTTFIYRHAWILSLYKKNSNGRELARPAVTRFATAYLTLQCILRQKNDLRSLFASEEWATSNYASMNEGKQVMNIVLSDARFWQSIQYCLKCVTPLVKVLRLVDGDLKPAMPYIYEAMDRAKEQIAANFKNKESRYKKVWKIIDTRWNLQFHRHLHAAAYYLNPKFHYDKNFNANDEVLNGLHETIEKMVPDRRTRFAIDQQLHKFKTATGLFGRSMAIDTRDKKQPALWWESYGGEGKELQRLAMRVLSLTCSATGCERNWSTFDQIHTKRRNRLEQQRLNALVYINYNLQLEMRQKSREEKGDAYDPICLSDIESDDEWITEKEDPCLAMDTSWMDIHESFTIEEGAPSKKRKRGPRNLNAKADKKGKSILIADESEIEEIVGDAEEEEEHEILEEEDEPSDIDLGGD